MAAGKKVSMTSSFLKASLPGEAQSDSVLTLFIPFFLYSFYSLLFLNFSL